MFNDLILCSIFKLQTATREIFSLTMSNLTIYKSHKLVCNKPNTRNEQGLSAVRLKISLNFYIQNTVAFETLYRRATDDILLFFSR